MQRSPGRSMKDLLPRSRTSTAYFFMCGIHLMAATAKRFPQCSIERQQDKGFALGNVNHLAGAPAPSLCTACLPATLTAGLQVYTPQPSVLLHSTTRTMYCTIRINAFAQIDAYLALFFPELPDMNIVDMNILRLQSSNKCHKESRRRRPFTVDAEYSCQQLVTGRCCGGKVHSTATKQPMQSIMSGSDTVPRCWAQ